MYHIAILDRRLDPKPVKRSGTKRDWDAASNIVLLQVLDHNGGDERHHI